MAKGRRGRPVNGILVLEKPGKQSSNAALQLAKRLYMAAKAGHTGSLDPLATGVLPVCFGESTKFSQYLLDSDKVYRSTFVLGQTTDTGDADGKMLEQCDASAVTEAQVLTALKQFVGVIEQVPSMFSALKYNGQPLYKLARQGKTVERKPRQVTVYNIQLEAFRCGMDEYQQGQEVDVYIHCSKGTYIRSIAEDLGHVLGCGAHVKVLHRIKAGPFDESQSVSFDHLQSITQNAALAEERVFATLDALLQPMDSALMHLPTVQLGETAVYYLLQGQAVQAPDWAIGECQVGSSTRLLAQNGNFLGIGEMLGDGRVSPKRLIATQ